MGFRVEAGEDPAIDLHVVIKEVGEFSKVLLLQQNPRAGGIGEQFRRIDLADLASAVIGEERFEFPMGWADRGYDVFGFALQGEVLEGLPPLGGH